MFRLLHLHSSIPFLVLHWSRTQTIIVSTLSEGFELNVWVRDQSCARITLVCWNHYSVLVCQDVAVLCNSIHSRTWVRKECLPLYRDKSLLRWHIKIQYVCLSLPLTLEWIVTVVLNSGRPKEKNNHGLIESQLHTLDAATMTMVATTRSVFH